MIAVSLMSVLKGLIKDLDLDPFTSKYLIHRYKNEGVKFLTVTLPKLSKALLYSLEKGYFVRFDNYVDLRCFAWKGSSLLHFRSLLNKIFGKDGRVLESACPVAIWQIRQLSEYFYKLSLSFDSSVLEQAEKDFVEKDLSLDGIDPDGKIATRLRKDFESNFFCSRSLPHDVFSSSRPRFGPGTFSGCTNNWYISKICRRQTLVYPAEYRSMSGFFKPYPSAPVRMKSSSDTSEYSELLFVPKDSRGPRTIVREPLQRLRAQLGFFDWFSTRLTRESNGRINFHDQQVNRDLALQGSITKEWSTIDLSSASDSVSYKLCREIFRNSPAVRYFLNKRSNYVILSSGKLHRIRKVAGMGSGLTFPILSLLCYLCSIRAIVDNTRLPYKVVKNLVYVYGDDIIVPSKYYNVVTQFLAKIGMTYNVGKSYTNGHFRESCGGDYFKGNNVAPIRIKLSGSSPQVEDGFLSGKNKNLFILELERHSRECVMNFLDNVANTFYAAIESAYGKLPSGYGETPFLVRYSRKPVHYESNGDGAYSNISAILPIPCKKSVANVREPYSYLSASLRSKGEDTLSFLDRSHGGSTFDAVSIPRQISLKRSKVSSFSLMG